MSATLFAKVTIYLFGGFRSTKSSNILNALCLTLLPLQIFRLQYRLFSPPKRDNVPRKPITVYSKTCVKRPLPKRPKFGFQYQLLLNEGQKYCRMLQVEHSAILSTFIKLSIGFKIILFLFFEWPFYTGFTVYT